MPLSHSDAADVLFVSAFLAAQVVISTWEHLGWVWPLFEIWQDKSKVPMKTVNAFIEPIVREAIEKWQNQEVCTGNSRHMG
jgi:hypothetical protein